LQQVYLNEDLNSYISLGLQDVGCMTVIFAKLE